MGVTLTSVTVAILISPALDSLCRKSFQDLF